MTINIIWDFDGVIADSERLWVENKRNILKDMYGIDWDSETAFKHMGGLSDTTRKERFAQMGLNIGEDFWVKAVAVDIESMKNGEMKLTPGVLDIIKNHNGHQCIATGGTPEKTVIKIESVELGKYFNDNIIFTAAMVAKGKPAPDLFLHAMEEMGWKKDECLVIEDSIAGMQAGIASGIKTIAYIGNCHLDKDKYIQEIKNIGDIAIFDDMKSLNEYINSL